MARSVGARELEGIDSLSGIEELGLDGPSITYRALAPGGSEVKVRFFGGALASSLQFRQRFQAITLELQDLARAQIPGCSHLLWAGEDQGELVMVTEWAPGVPLSDLRAGSESAQELLRQARATILAVHGFGLAHGRLDARRIYWRSGEAMITDFAIASLLDDAEASAAADLAALDHLELEFAAAPALDAPVSGPLDAAPEPAPELAPAPLAIPPPSSRRRRRAPRRRATPALEPVIAEPGVKESAVSVDAASVNPELESLESSLAAWVQELFSVELPELAATEPPLEGEMEGEIEAESEAGIDATSEAAASAGPELQEDVASAPAELSVAPLPPAADAGPAISLDQSPAESLAGDGAGAVESAPGAEPSAAVDAALELKVASIAEVALSSAPDALHAPQVVVDPDRPEPAPAPGAGLRSLWRKASSTVNTILVGVVAVLVLLVALLAVGPYFTPFQAYSVLSGSMRPTIPVGALIIVQKVNSSQLKVGDVISFTRPDNPAETITHRIYKIDQTPTGRVYETKGDANPVPDNWRVTLKGVGWRYMFDIPGLGYLITYAGSQYGRLALILIPGLILGALYLLDMWRPKTQVVSNAA